MSREPATKVPVERLLEELLEPEAYGHQVERVLLRQTHISLLFFAGERVYKLKKPVDLGFLDFTTLERRRFFCEEEVRLNRRLAPGIYLGVVPITEGAEGRLRIGGEGAPLEWAVEMVRLPEHRMLSELLQRGEIDNAQMNATAALLADFHAGSPTGAGVDEHGAPEAVAGNEEENFEQLDEFTGPSGVLSVAQLDFLRARRRGWLAEHRALLERRVREGRVREGHGDLHAGNLCLTERGLVAYDCIEFSRRFRCGDVAADLAFLTMDLDQRGYPAFSRYLARRYARLAEDPGMLELEPFYKGYRAIVRAKVAALTTLDPGLSSGRREALRREAMRYAQLAVGYELPPSLILMCGLPASGKSWLARRLAGALRATELHSDTRRKVLARMQPTERAHEDFETGLYAPAAKQEVYASLRRDVSGLLEAGHSVVVDATFSRRAYRAPFLADAARRGRPCCVVHVDAADALIRARLEQRALDPAAISDADLDVYLHSRATFEPPVEAALVATVSGAGAPEVLASEVLDRIVAAAG